MALRRHAATVVDDQSDRNRDIVVTEILDGLQHTVFVHPEIVLVEPRDQNVLAVLRGGAQDHDVDIYFDGVFAARAGWSRGRFLCPSPTRQCNRERNQNVKRGDRRKILRA